jgi:hypothetical protein
MQWFCVPAPRRPLAVFLDHAVASLPAEAISRLGDEIPNRRAWRRKVGLNHPDRIGALNDSSPALAFPRPRLLEVAHPTLRLADMLDRFGVLNEARARGSIPVARMQSSE